MESFQDAWVWAKDPKTDFLHGAKFQSYVTGSKMAVVRLVDGVVSVGDGRDAAATSLRPMDPLAVNGVDDLTSLSELHEGALFHNLQVRFKKNLVYTYVGNILLAMNPYKTLNIYGTEMVHTYRGKQLGDLPPHVFAVANYTYSSMTKTGMNQCIVISGESGAGKTETTKLLINFLASVSSKKTLVQEQILDASPLLEAIGNAKTVRNDNSSRFGKFLEIQFDQNGNIIGSLTRQYLLEKSRIVTQAAEERNYHVFYYLLAGASPELRATLKLTNVKDYHCLNQSAHDTITAKESAEQFGGVQQAMRTLNMTVHETQMWTAVAAVLHLSNVTFAKVNRNNAEGSKVTNTEVVATVASLLRIDAAQLEKSLVSRMTIARTERIVTPMTEMQAADARDALAKAIYGRLFSWCVTFINETTRVKSTAEIKSVGVLDIFGFEDFKINSFEQLCINFANERLQFFFNKCVFKMEQDEYVAEEIGWNMVSYVDNQGTIDLISKKPSGLLAVLDEECSFPKASDATFLAKLHQNHGSNPVYVKPKGVAPVFGIRHYAGEITYQADGFLDKNRDSLQTDMQELMQSSGHKLIADWFVDSSGDELSPSSPSSPSMDTISLSHSSLKVPKGGPSGSHQTINLEVLTHGKLAPGSPAPGHSGSLTRKKSAKLNTTGFQFNNSLNDLLSTLIMCNPTFVRCLKPNMEKQAMLVDGALVRAQLRYCGMLETIRVRQSGASYRIRFEDVVQRYRVLLSDKDRRSGAPAIKLAQLILAKLPADCADKWQFGKTKVFMKNIVNAALERMRAELIISTVVLVQSFVRMAVYRLRYLKKQKSAQVIQQAFRAHQVVKKRNAKANSVAKIQALYRGRRARKRYAVEIAAVRAEIERKKRPPAVEGKPSKAPSKAKALSNQIEDGVVIQSLDNMFGELKVLEDSLETLQDESQRINKEANRAGINELKRGELQKQAGLMRYLEKSEQNRLAQARNAIAAAGADQQEYSVEFPTELGALLKTSKPVFVGPLPASAQSYMLNTSKSSRKLFGTVQSSVVTSDDAAWSKFGRIYFRDGSPFTYRAKPLSESLLRLAVDLNVPAMVVNQTLLRCVAEEVDGSVLLQAINFVLSIGERLVETHAEGMRFLDEIVCQAMCLTQSAPNEDAANRAWLILSALLGVITPSKDLSRAISVQNASSDIRSKARDIQYKLKRGERKAPRRGGMSSVELIATAKNNPVLFDATFDDKASAGRFQVDSFATGMEVLPSLLRAKKISSAEGYQLFLEADGGVRVPVGDNQCVLEAVAHMERIISATSKPRQQDIDVVMHCLTAVKLKPHGLGGNAVAPQETRKP